ncbi:MAG: hypothetical protein HQL95_12300 [Magnetococcales bacterium]|nr:hypothetical protein [Magnetococcales bacterium]
MNRVPIKWPGLSLLVWMVLFPARGGWSGDPADCLSCHRERDAALTAAWEKSRHGSLGVGCPACHGLEHAGLMARRARDNATCTGCHAGETKSYLLSKHGVIVALGGEGMDLSLALQAGNQRAPVCAYCHMHNGQHDAGSGLAPQVARNVPPDAGRSVAREAPCRDCHSPRFVDTWFVSGNEMVELGGMKFREAQALVARFDNPQAREILQRMDKEHLRNVRLGVGHQSPDDQWWHGHPALDGDLLRIKTLFGEALGERAPEGRE